MLFAATKATDTSPIRRRPLPEPRPRSPLAGVFLGCGTGGDTTGRGDSLRYLVWGGAIRGVAVTDEVARCLIPWECFGDLAGDPLGGWICCHIGPDELSPLQTQDDQPVEQFEPDRRNDEQIDAGDVGGVIAQESVPTRRARAVTP